MAAFSGFDDRPKKVTVETADGTVYVFENLIDLTASIGFECGLFDHPKTNVNLDFAYIGDGCTVTSTAPPKKKKRKAKFEAVIPGLGTIVGKIKGSKVTGTFVEDE